MILDTVVEKKKGTHTRYLILLIIFIVTAVNYADRATLSIAGTEVPKSCSSAPYQWVTFSPPSAGPIC